MTNDASNHVTTAKPGDLSPHPRNSRIHSTEQIVKLRASIREFGVVRPIVVDENNVILAGHGIHEAAIAEQCDVVPIHVKTGLTDEQKRAYLIADNKLAELSIFDPILVAEELENLKVTELDLAVMGFDVTELAAYLDDSDLMDYEPEAATNDPTLKTVSFALRDEDYELFTEKCRALMETDEDVKAYPSRLGGAIMAIIRNA